MELQIPPLSPVPPAIVRKIIQGEEWEACLEAWITLAELHLRMTAKEFSIAAPKDKSVVAFLSSYFKETSSRSLVEFHGLFSSSKAKNLRRLCFLLTRRLLLEVHPVSSQLLDWEFLGDLSACYVANPSLRKLLLDAWMQETQAMTFAIEQGKFVVMKQLSLPDAEHNWEAVLSLRRLTLLASLLPQVGHVLMTGSDYLDTIFEAYNNHRNESLRKALVANSYVGFTSLIKLEPPATSLLLDQLFSLKASAGLDSRKPVTESTLLSDLICGSNLLIKMERLFSNSSQKRGAGLMATLRAYRVETSAFHTRHRRSSGKDKGKRRAIEGQDAVESHIQKASLLAQVQDLFPNLESNYILKLLDYYSDEVETVIAHLLDDALPIRLRDSAHSEEHQTPDVALSLNPGFTQLPEQTSRFVRRNLYDDDDFDRLSVSASTIHFGRMNADLTADNMLADRSNHLTNKAAILSALATFDSDDDEHDDTYDMADVGGTVDSIGPGTDTDADLDPTLRICSRQKGESNGTALYQLYKSSPELFDRDAATRRSPQRVALRKDTGMTDEAIEGWALTLARDPKRMSKLERNFVLSGGLRAHEQRSLPSTSYRKPSTVDSGTGTGTDGSEAEGGINSNTGVGHGSAGRGGCAGGRGRGRGKTGGRENVGYPSRDHDTAIARRRKDANIASRSKHNSGIRGQKR
jgi:activating signal cointegrator complex subunit 2